MAIHRRHLRQAVRSGTWKHLGRRAAWRIAARDDRPTVPLTWPISKDMAAQVRIRWPTRINAGRPSLKDCADRIKSGIAAHVPIEHADIPQPVGGVVLFHLLDRGAPRRVVIDTDDRMVLNDSANEADLYFKMQYARGGYGSPHIRPGGYVCLQHALYRYRWNWRKLRRRTVPSYDVYGRFGTTREKQDVRAGAISLLQAQNRFGFQGGAGAVWWGEYMDEMCNARVCLDLPGRGEFCYRLVEYLAVGACVIGPELATEMPAPLEPGVHLVRVPRSLDGLVDECERLLRDDALRETVGRAAETYFDRYLSLEQLGAYYVDALWHTLHA
jgi:Glycosyl transferases group 1